MEKWKELSAGKKRFWVAVGIIVIVAAVGWVTGWWSSPDLCLYSRMYDTQENVDSESVSGGGALVGGLASTGVLAPVTGAVVSSAVADVATEVAIGKGGKGNMSSCAPDNFWSLLGSLIEMGGWALILIVIVPMVFSWLMPGPIQFKGRKSK
jgi:ABC-type Fe3+ transport system permease subunit